MNWPSSQLRRSGGRRSYVGDEDQGVTVPDVMCGREPRWEPRGRTAFRDSGLIRTTDSSASEVTD